MTADELEPPTGGSPSPADVPDAHDGAGVEPLDTAGAALGALAPDDEAAVRAAATHDAAIAAELAEFEAVVAELARLAPSEPMNRGRSAGIRSRLITRAAASRAGRPATRQAGPLASIAPPRGDDIEKLFPVPELSRDHPERRGTTRLSTERRVSSRPVPPSMERRGRFWARALVGLAAAAVVVTAAGGYALWRERDVRDASPVAGAPSRADSLAGEVAQLRSQLAKRDSMIATLTGAQTRVMELTSYAPSSPSGKMFWDQKNQRWTMFVSRMRQPAPGRTYEVWLIARNHPAPIPAGTFAPDSSGSAHMEATYALAPGDLRKIAITEEPAGGAPAPTGPIVMAGAGR